MRNKIAIVTLFYIVLFAVKSHAQVQERYFRNISVDNGLSQSSVFAIQQDTLGFIWIGTLDGLNRYDSKGFKVYKPIKNVKSSLQSYYIRSLFTDHKGRLWVGGNKGISVYNYDSDSFVNYQLPRSIGEWFISSITEDNLHQIWATSITGDVFVLSPQEKNFTPIKFKVSSHEIKKISYIGLWQHQIILGTDVGLFKFNPKKNQLIKINLGIKKPSINNVYVDGTNLLVATEGNGLINYNFKNRHISILQHSTNTNSLVDNNIRCIEKDTEGNIWLGTYRGLSIYNPKSNTTTNYYHQISQPYTISQNSVRCFFKDKQNGIWLGTYYAGINYYHKDDIKFNLLSQNSVKPSLNDEVIGVIKQDPKGDFWIGTNDKGINYWNKKTNTISYFTNSENNPNSLSSNNIKSIAFDDSGNVLIGTHSGGLNLLNPRSGLVERFTHDENNSSSIAGDLVYSVLKDSKNRIWVGTRSGLDQFHPKTKTFTHIHLDKAGKRLSSDDITYLFEDSKYRIWIGTTNGVTLFYPDSQLFGDVEGGRLSLDIVKCIIEDNKHRIWIGTREGLRLYNETQESFKSLESAKDFIKETIYGIVPDDDGNLWISTNSGLVKFNFDKNSVQTFGVTDGLQNRQFNEYSFCKAKDGMILFGGIKGLSYFYPSMIKQQPLPLKLSFTAIEVLNKTVVVNDETNILEKHVDQTEVLKIGPEYKQFSIFFNTFNYISSNRTYYYYKLDGIDKDWQRTDELKISYSNLPAGNYSLSVKAIGPNGERSSTRSMKIVILSPWYKTMWFSLLLLVIISTIAYIVFRIIKERIMALQQLKLERLDKERVGHINQLKMEFFTNVSHELRTPLTLILAPLEELLKMPFTDKVVKKKHELMFANAKRLYNLVDQLFQFRKTEMGTRRLKVSKSDIVIFTQEIFNSFKPLSDKNKIHFTFQSSETALLFYFDKDAMEKILFNLLSNAFKYTKANQSVNIELLKKNDVLEIKITDTGIGIVEEDLSKVFDRFYQVNNNEMNLGSGVGLAFTKSLVELHHGEITAESTKDKGTNFTVFIPILDSIYINDQHEERSNDKSGTVVDNEIENEPDLLLEDESIIEKTKPVKILIVDDNKDILEYLQDYFSSIYEVTIAQNGLEALEKLDIQPVDIIISDVMMPELDGLHFCKRVKQNINTSHIPVLLLTARIETSQQIRGLEMGADDYVTKPFSTPLLATKIANLLRSRKRLKEYYSSSKEMVPENIAFNPLDEEFLKQAIHIVEDHLSDSEFSVDQFSKEIGMSRSNLYLKLKAITGESAMDFIKRIRFKKAVELMQSKRYTIAQITYMCGFNSPSYFSTAFKQHYSCMPSEYLAKLDDPKEMKNFKTASNADCVELKAY